jgi:hypothetical protein
MHPLPEEASVSHHKSTHIAAQKQQEAGAKE